MTPSGKQRSGLSTGTCVAAAAKAAVKHLVKGDSSPVSSVDLPEGGKATLTVTYRTADSQTAGIVDMDRWGERMIEAVVMKDSGDDPDITDGMLICVDVAIRHQQQGAPDLTADVAPASLEEFPQVELWGGHGVGVATKEGLPVPPGEAAINPVPRRMICEAIVPELPPGRIATVIVHLPSGESLAPRTFNPRLGIVGGLSILGTSGTVEPLSRDAVIATMRSQVSVAMAAGMRSLVLTPGRKGSRWAVAELGIEEERVIEVGNEWGDAIVACADAGVEEVLLAAHPSKLSKLAAGHVETHSRSASVPFEMLARVAQEAGAPSEVVTAVGSAVTFEGFLPELASCDTPEHPGVMRTFFELLARGIVTGAHTISGDRLRVGVAMYDRDLHVLFAQLEDRGVA